jgi:uncharacterized protein (DUF697 family)
MATEEQSWVSKKLTAASIGLDAPDEQARAVVLTAVGINTAMGAVPFGINMLTFLSVDVAMIAALGAIYGYTYSHEQAGQLVKDILSSVGVGYSTYFLVAKLFAESTKAAGVAITPFYVLGMSTDMFITGGITYAVGFTSKKYFEQGAAMSRADMRRTFRQALKDKKSHDKQPTWQYVTRRWTSP